MTASASEPLPMRVTDDERKRIKNRLNRLEGQVRGLQSMVDEDKDCQAVLNQVVAAKSALNQVGLLIIAHSMKSCLADSAAIDRDEIIDEALSMLLRYVNLPESGVGPLEG
jgi:DNA-binding FrmR family transcriptional regulator